MGKGYMYLAQQKRNGPRGEGTDVGIRERGASKEVERGGDESLILERGKIRF